jgi:hypothetical protein
MLTEERLVAPTHRVSASIQDKATLICEASGGSHGCCCISSLVICNGVVPQHKTSHKFANCKN